LRSISLAKRAIFFCASVTLAGCAYFDSEPQPGIYRAVIESPAGELPFGLQLEDSGSAEAGFSAFILNGAERIEVQDVSRAEKRLVLTLPGEMSKLTFTAHGNKLAGTIRLVEEDGSAQELPFAADLGKAFRFFPESMTDNADVAGRWSASIAQPAGNSRLVADLMQSHDQIAAVFYDRSGGQQKLTGQVQDDEFRLSGFDGSTALLYAATVNEAGDLAGEYWSSRTGAAHWTARRDPDAEVAPETGQTEATL
jgi:hypothetical protein